MKYEIWLNSREYEIAHAAFDAQAYDAGAYDETPRIGMDREAWMSMPDIGLVPLYLHYVGVFEPEPIIERAQGVVTTASVFAIFDKKDLTFAEMLQEIWKRRKEIVKVTEGDGNPYEDDCC
jgi:hypothetical protein